MYVYSHICTHIGNFNKTLFYQFFSWVYADHQPLAETLKKNPLFEGLFFFVCGLSTGPSVSVSLHYFKEQLFACEETDAGDLGRPTHHSTFTQLIFNDLPFNAVHLS